MATDGELPREGGERAEWDEEDDADVDDEATLFSLELEGAGHQEEGTDKKEDGNKVILGGGEVAVAAVEASRRGDAAAAEALATVGPAARLRALARRLRNKTKAAAAGAVTAAEERRTPAEVALKYLMSKVPSLACRSGMADGPGDDASPPPTVLPGRKSRGSSVATSPPPTPPRREDSLLQAQDGVAGAIAYCKLSLQLPSSKGL